MWSFWAGVDIGVEIFEGEEIDVVEMGKWGDRGRGGWISVARPPLPNPCSEHASHRDYKKCLKVVRTSIFL